MSVTPDETPGLTPADGVSPPDPQYAANNPDCYLYYEDFTDDTTVVHRRISNPLAARVYENPEICLDPDCTIQVVDLQVPQQDTVWETQYVDLENDRILVHCPDLEDHNDTLIFIQPPGGGYSNPHWALRNGEQTTLRFSVDTLFWHPYEGQSAVIFEGGDLNATRDTSEARLHLCVVGSDDDDEATCVITLPLVVNVARGPVGLTPEPKCRFTWRGRTVEDYYTGNVYRFGGSFLPNDPDKQIVTLGNRMMFRIVGDSTNWNLIRWSCRRGWSPEVELVVPDSLPRWAENKFSLEIHPADSAPVVVFAGRVPQGASGVAHLQLRLYHLRTPAEINRVWLYVHPRCFSGLPLPSNPHYRACLLER